MIIVDKEGKSTCRVSVHSSEEDPPGDMMETVSHNHPASSQSAPGSGGISDPPTDWHPALGVGLTLGMGNPCGYMDV